jgi:YidC/Oxa1 family membrane protein insertase
MNKILNNKTIKMIGVTVLVLFVALFLVGCGCAGQSSGDGTVEPNPIVGFKSFWDLFVWPMAALMWVVGKAVGGNYGLTIIITTILVRTAAWPIYTKTNDMSLKTQLMAPEMEKLEAKYAGKDDQESQQRKQMEMMQLYKKYGIGIGGCLLPFLQMPLFLGFFQALRRIPDTLDTTLKMNFAFMNQNFLGLNLFMNKTDMPEQATKIWILAIAVGVLQVLSQILTILRQKWQKKQVYSDIPEYRKPQQTQQNKSQNIMMNVFAFAMSVMMVVFVLGNPAGLGLYWLVGNLYTMIQAQISFMLTEKRLAKLRAKYNKE